MLPEVVWQMPSSGTFNLHATLLPQYRGAAPINRAIMNGETETGLTTFFLQHQIDTGHILLQDRNFTCDNEPAGELQDRLMDKRSEERSVGKELFRTCRSRWSQYRYTNNIILPR